MENFLLPQVNTSIALFTLSLVLRYFLSKSITTKYKSPKNSPPPQAGGAWPIIGHLHQLRGSQLPHMTLAAMADKHGPIFTLRLRIHRAVVVSNSEIAKECFTTHDVAVSSRPKFARFPTPRLQLCHVWVLPIWCILAWTAQDNLCGVSRLVEIKIQPPVS